MPGTSWPWVRSKAIELARSTRVVQDTRCFMALGAIELARLTRVAQKAKHFMVLGAIECNRTRPFDSELSAWSGDQSKTIELTCFTQVAQEGNRISLFDSGGTGCQVLYDLEINRRQSNIHLTLMAQDAKRCMVWRSIEGNRTHPFDSDGAVCQALHRLEINLKQSNSPVLLR